MMIKTPKQIEIMAESGTILAHVLQKVKNEIKPGISTLDLDTIAFEEIIKSGAKPAFKGFHQYPNTTCISINDEVVHGIPSANKIIKSGDIISVDCGVLYKGWNTDSALTVAVGSVPQKTHKLIDTTKKSLMDAIKVIKPGVHFSKVQAIIQHTIEKQGFSVVRNLSGHGIGRSVHESPSIYNFVGQGPNMKLKTGMTFCLEPMTVMGKPDVYTKHDNWTIASVDKTLSAHFEHTIAVTENGYQILTK